MHLKRIVFAVAFLASYRCGDALSFTFQIIADTNTSIPGGFGTFVAGFNPPSVDGTDVAFLGGDGQTQTGLYKSSGGLLQVVADYNTSVPGGSGNFAVLLSNYGMDG